MSAPRLAMVGGGSGGDTYPVVATARAVEAAAPGAEFLFFGTAGGIEADLLGAEGFRPVMVPAVRLKKSTVLKLPFVLCQGTRKARAELARFGADVVVSGGGFVSPPVVLAARSLGVPVVQLEPNSVAGRANRVLARFASLVVTAYESAAGDFPDPSRVTCLGMPLRYRFDEERRGARRGSRRARLVVGIVGGSLGARCVNQAVWSQYRELSGVDGLEVVHVTGRRDHQEALRKFAEAGEPANIEVRPYQGAMDELYDEVDVLVARAGAMTCAEVIEFSVPALFVPRELSVGDHQWKNAAPLAALGAAEALREKDWSAAVLMERVRTWLDDPSLLDAMRAAYAPLRRSAAGAAVAARVLDIAGRRQEVAA